MSRKENLPPVDRALSQECMDAAVQGVPDDRRSLPSPPDTYAWAKRPNGERYLVDQH